MYSSVVKPSPASPARHLRAVTSQKSEVTDEVVLQAWENGEPGFGALLYDHLIAPIDGTLYRILGERTPEHDDLAQNTFEQVLLTLTEGKFKRECSLKSWAAAIAARIGLNAIRSRKTFRKYFAAEGLVGVATQPSLQDVEMTTERRERLRRVRRELGHLSRERAETLVLHDVLGHSLAEVAAMTGVTAAAAQSRLVRGRKELHARLASVGLLGSRA